MRPPRASILVPLRWPSRSRHLQDDLGPDAAGGVSHDLDGILHLGIDQDVGAHRRASARRSSFGSIANTFQAPAARAIATAKSPIGPHPMTATGFVARSSPPAVPNVACTALPNGSMIDATSGRIPSPTTHAFCAGMTTYSANAPSVSTPKIRRFSQMCILPVRHVEQCPQAMCVSAATRPRHDDRTRRSPVDPTGRLSVRRHGGAFVAAETHIACGHCSTCRTGRMHICENLRILGVDTDGAFAEYVVIRHRMRGSSARGSSPTLHRSWSRSATPCMPRSGPPVARTGDEPRRGHRVRADRALRGGDRSCGGRLEGVRDRANDDRRALAATMGADILVDPRCKIPSRSCETPPAASGRGRPGDVREREGHRRGTRMLAEVDACRCSDSPTGRSRWT